MRREALTLCLLQVHRTEREMALYPPFVREVGRRRIAWTGCRTRTRRETKQRVLAPKGQLRCSDAHLLRQDAS